VTLDDLAEDRCRFCRAPLPWPRRADMVYCRGGRCCQRHGDALLAEARRVARAGKRCAECSRAFEARSAKAVYCSKLCGLRASRRRAAG
jgi:hypothetical protein